MAFLRIKILILKVSNNFRATNGAEVKNWSEISDYSDLQSIRHGYTYVRLLHMCNFNKGKSNVLSIMF